MRTMEQNLKNTDIEQPTRRYTLQEYQQMVENGRRQVQNGECFTTEEVMAYLNNSLKNIL